MLSEPERIALQVKQFTAYGAMTGCEWPNANNLQLFEQQLQKREKWEPALLDVRACKEAFVDAFDEFAPVMREALSTNRYTFRQVRRDCPHNDTLDAANEKRGIIYDFDVVDCLAIETIGRWHRNAASKGYRLYDRSGKQIQRVEDNWKQDISAQRQDQFTIMVVRWRDLIPTAEQIAQREAAAVVASQKRVVTEKAKASLQVKQRHAEALFDFVAEIATRYDNQTTATLQLNEDVLEPMSELHTTMLGEIVDWHAAIDRGE